MRDNSITDSAAARAEKEVPNMASDSEPMASAEIEPESASASASPARQLPTGVRQFVKFCIVGLSSTIIDWTIFYLMYHFVMFPNHIGGIVMGNLGLARGGKTFEIAASKVCSVTFGVMNGFYWNSRWTFRALDAPNRKQQFSRFVAVNIVGMLMNTTIVTAIMLPFTSGGRQPSGAVTLVANAIATSVVVFWNFFANRYWTFKPQQPAVSRGG